MGKIRAKKRKTKSRPCPTGLPSVKETKQEQDENPSITQDLPLLKQLQNPSPSEREWACRSLSHLVTDESTLAVLMQNKVIRKLTPLLLDEISSVREAAAGALRNLSTMDNLDFREQMIQEDIMTPLSLMLKDCLGRLEKVEKQDDDTPMEGSTRSSPSKGKMKERRQQCDFERQQLLGVLEQGLHLLWNVSEYSQTVVEVFNRENLLILVLQLLQTSLYPPSLVLVAAQLLHTITEDNQEAIKLLCSSQDHLGHLEIMLAVSDDDQSNSHRMLLKTYVAGVFQNLLPGIPEPFQSQTLRGVLAFLVCVLETDISPLLHSLSTTPPPTPPQTSDPSELVKSCPSQSVASSTQKSTNENETMISLVQDTLSAQQLALEIIANMCYIESEDSDEWEDVEEEEILGDAMDVESEQKQDSPPPENPPALQIITELMIPEKIWRMSHSADVTAQQACVAIANGDTILASLNTIRDHSLLTLQNLISALPVETWGSKDNLAEMWSSLISLLHQLSDVGPLLGTLVVLSDRLNSLGCNCVAMEHVHLLSQSGMKATDNQVKVDTINVLGTAGKMSLKQHSSNMEMLNVIGCALRDYIATDHSLWVVSQALDCMFDIFGDDNCPLSLFASLSLMPVLRQCASTFKARLRVEKVNLGSHLGFVQNTRINLPRFIDYMGSKMKS